MDPAHLHLMINHLPIMGAFLSLPLLAIALWRRREKSAMIGAAVVLSLAAVGAVVALRSGEPAEERVEDMPGISEPWIEEHEERAEAATVLAVLTALGALGSLGFGWRREDGAPVWMTGIVLAGALATSGAMGWTGLAGGQIHHPELRADGGAGPGGSAGAPAEDEHEDEEGEEEPVR